MAHFTINLLVATAVIAVTSANVWWHHAVIYQIYPRSFYDSNGDGIGDLRGIIQKIDYIIELGVDAVWLSPIYPSPNKDFGYDVMNFTSIDKTYGTMDDFAELVSKFHAAGIKVIMDFVPNHTSDEHPWFNASMHGNSKYKDYYVWRSSSKVGPPNNWRSSFGSSAWTYNSIRKQYYLHQFLESQPDLNYANQDVIKDMQDVLSFWLYNGVDGFRMDAVYAMVEDKSFADEPMKPGCNDPSNYGCYNHIYTADQDGTYEVLSQFRRTIDLTPHSVYDSNATRMMVTESYTSNWTQFLQYYRFNNKEVANFPFNFAFVTDTSKESRAVDWVNVINKYLGMTKGYPINWLLGNHDQTRVATRLGREMVDALNMMLLLLKGTVFSYNGEELGMTNSYVRWDQGKDPQGCMAGPANFEQRSRDPQRGPFSWNNTDNAGFTWKEKPWLPVSSDYWTVNQQDQNSTTSNTTHLNIYKQMVQLRKTYIVRKGDCDVMIVNKNPDVMAIYRSAPDNPSAVGVYNFGSNYVTVNLLEERDSLPEHIYLMAWSPNAAVKDIKLGAQFNATEIDLPPKGAKVFITQDLKIPLKIDDTTTLSFGL